MKIGLIAMSGVRVCDAELKAFGLSLPGLIERGTAIASLPSLALLTIAGMTPARHQVTYVEIPDLKTCGPPSDDFDLVAISSYSAQISEAYELSKWYLSKGIPTVIGGPHATCLPQEAAKYCTAVAIGEAEPIWLQILQDAEKRQLKKFYGERYNSFDLRHSPLPAYDLLEPQKYNRVTVQTSRGCPHRCEFCAASVLLSKKYRQKPVSMVLAEIDALQSIWERPFIEFADDNGMSDRRYWRELLPQMKKRKTRWFLETDISVGDDDDILKMMQESGCRQVLVGLESPVIQGMDGIELKRNWKRDIWHTYRDSVRKIQSRGIRVIGAFIIGLDGQGPEIFDQMLDFVDYLELFDVQITVQTPFPGTPLYDRLKSEDRLLDAENWDKCSLFDVNFKPSNMSSEQLRTGFRELGEKLYNEEATKRRRASFKKYMRSALHSRTDEATDDHHSPQGALLPIRGV